MFGRDSLFQNVTAQLGKPEYHFQPGQDWHGWDYRVRPEYKQDHHMYIYYIDAGGMGPHLLFVYTDNSNAVTFVSSDPT